MRDPEELDRSLRGFSCPVDELVRLAFVRGKPCETLGVAEHVANGSGE